MTHRDAISRVCPAKSGTSSFIGEMTPSCDTRHASERWTLVFEAENAGPPMTIRIRRLLKAVLRAYGLRCVVAEVKPVDVATGKGEAQAGKGSGEARQCQ